LAYDLVIFDCDGVLVDSEPICSRVLSEELGALGLELSVDQVTEEFVGCSWPDTLARIERRLGRPIPPHFHPRLGVKLVAALESELQPVPGIPELLRTVTVPFCVASNGGEREVRTSLRTAGLLDHFQGRIFTAAQVARGKPAPDLFLHAAAVMGADPRRSVVVEDTVVGVRAAVAAGMDVLGYTGTFPAATLEAEGAVAFADMTELIGLLERPGRGEIG
jgi:HAD superfamily hydrolase (TIGR01509 family)